ncbi:C40 family peptidase [Alkalihalophilus marmarensis]|uniref:C40 family peptidase n=1 Tax=Alkalihalophilus marmarensis TaxID=521377 RepID=UPI002DBE9A04|nr:peptidoglycan-binding protein [Alkalihalophilus marmarensis]MEC2071323.1 peptidoglycan-binding protein [Alkalihalophilus marmarensis]
MKKVLVTSVVAAGLFFAAPQMADAALGDQTLRVGMNHADVTELQEALKSKGYFTFDRATGYYGTITADAVRKFQASNGLKVDGIAGPQTFAALKANGSTVVAASSSNTSSATLRAGSRGAAVTNLQQQLRNHGHFSSAVDGVFGPLTERAVRSFQSARGLSVDGIAGPQTFSALGQAAVSGSTTQAAASTTLRQGARSAEVTRLQDRLRQLGYFNSNSTGYYGTVTTESVRRFQAVNKLQVDGVAGPQTLSRLHGSNAAAASTASETVSASSSNSSIGSSIISSANRYIGTPYRYGGTTTAGFDCSGFIQRVFSDVGISVPRTALQQWNSGTTVAAPSVGDIVFFATVNSGPSHNGIYIGNNQFIHSGSSTGVTVTSMNNSYWSARYLGAKRIH